MKKLSVSLIAVVAILFAVASAFTTQKANVSDPYQAGWHLVLNDDPYFLISDPLATQQSSYESAVVTTDDQEILEVCPDTVEEFVCAGKFDGENIQPSEFSYREE